jgi:hypothetical protein
LSSITKEEFDTEEDSRMLFKVQIGQRFHHTIVVEAPDREAIRGHDWHEYHRDPGLADPVCYNAELLYIEAVRAPEDDRDDLEALADPLLDPLLREILESSERAPDPMPIPDLIVAAPTERRDDEKDPDLRAREAEAIWYYFRYRYERSVCIALSYHQGVSTRRPVPLSAISLRRRMSLNWRSD